MPEKYGGMSTSSHCPRGGTIWLTTDYGTRLVMPTVCKTWSCSGCRDRLMSLFTMRVEAGILTLGRCSFMTVTYRMGQGLQKDAQSVAKDWKALWRRLKKVAPEVTAMKWFRVIELTKNGQPHLHLVIGPVKGRIRCYGAEGLDARRFKARMGTCGCLAHVVSRVWLGVTGDSWVVDATPVAGAGGAGSYLAKYLRKGSLNRMLLERLGFIRRWSSSRGWPGSGRIRLRQTLEGGWARSDFSPVVKWKEPKIFTLTGRDLGVEDNPLLDRVGPDLVKKLGERRMARGSLAYLKRSISYDTNVPASAG